MTFEPIDVNALPEPTGPRYEPREGPPTFRGVHRTKTTEAELAAYEAAEAESRWLDALRNAGDEFHAEQARYEAWRVRVG